MYKLFIILLSSIIFVEGQRPNVVLFLTDDQDVVLDGMTPLESVQKLIGNEGATFTNSFVASPICCPSRASILSGMYPHNHKTFKNDLESGCNGPVWKEIENNTFGSILHNHGYSTFYAGKYLNQYGTEKTGGPGAVPPGWTEWHGLVGNSVYYNFTMSNNGVPTHSYEGQYLTDLVRSLALNFIEAQGGEQPFLMVLAPPAPHQPFTPAPRHLRRYANLTAKRSPTFNIKPNNKHWLMSMPPTPLPESMMAELDSAFRSRWAALLAVDEMVADVTHALDKINALHNTYLIYTSDNGYHVGQFSQVYDKRQPYETDIRVPFLIKGPNIPRNVTIKHPIINVDLAPTILNLAGVEVPATMDGEPLRFNMDPRKPDHFEERIMLVEYYGENSTHSVSESCPWKYDVNLAECNPKYECKCQDSRNNTYGCVRHLHPSIDFKYCLFNDTKEFEEMYDLRSDPYEMVNIASDTLPALKYYYSQLLDQLRACKGHKQCGRPDPYDEGPHVVMV